MSELARYRLEGKIAVVEMDDGKANALSDAMIDHVTAALTVAASKASSLGLAARPCRLSAGVDPPAGLTP